MTQTQSPGPRPTDGLDRFCERVRATGIRRRLTDRWVAGVCAGVADALGVDPVVVRIAWGLTLAMGGVGVPAYFLAFSLMADTAQQIPLEKAVRHGDGDSVILLVLTGLLVLDHVGDLGAGRRSMPGAWPWRSPGAPWPRPGPGGGGDGRAEVGRPSRPGRPSPAGRAARRGRRPPRRRRSRSPSRPGPGPDAPRSAGPVRSPRWVWP